jgi:xanthine dehydrogenase accessory factor
MLITAGACHDTIGGGHLEWRAMAEARLWLHERNADPAQRERLLDLTLGASLGQCCGGALQLRLERVDFWTAAERTQRLQDLHTEQQTQTPLYLFGAGHVGQALVQVLQAVPGRIVWVDEREHLFPADVSPQVQCEATDIPEALIAAAPPVRNFW